MLPVRQGIKCLLEPAVGTALLSRHLRSLQKIRYCCRRIRSEMSHDVLNQGHTPAEPVTFCSQHKAVSRRQCFSLSVAICRPLQSRPQGAGQLPAVSTETDTDVSPPRLRVSPVCLREFLSTPPDTISYRISGRGPFSRCRGWGVCPRVSIALTVASPLLCARSPLFPFLFTNKEGLCSVTGLPRRCEALPPLRTMCLATKQGSLRDRSTAPRNRRFPPFLPADPVCCEHSSNANRVLRSATLASSEEATDSRDRITEAKRSPEAARSLTCRSLAFPSHDPPCVKGNLHTTERSDSTRKFRNLFSLVSFTSTSSQWPRILVGSQGNSSVSRLWMSSSSRPSPALRASSASEETDLVGEATICRDVLTPRGILVLKTSSGTGKADAGSLPGGPWIFSNQVASCSLHASLEMSSRRGPTRHGVLLPSSPDGMGDEARPSEKRPESTLVRVQDERGISYGVAYYNRHALIAARVLSEDAGEAIDDSFFRRRFRTALESRLAFSRSFSWNMRKAKNRDTATTHQSLCDNRAEAAESGDNFFRLVNGEGDGLPGLVVDLYGKYACIQSLTRGMDSLMPLVTSALRGLLDLRGILVRRDKPDRALEFPDSPTKFGASGASSPAWISEPEVAAGDIPREVVLTENGCVFAVDLRQQLETGWRFDRRDFRRQVALLSRGKQVLDLFGHSAACGITCMHLGKAERCVVVESNERSAQLALQSMQLNGIGDKLEIHQEDVDKWIKNYADHLDNDRDPCYFDVVILDPPNLAPRKSDVPGARISFQRLVEAASRLTAPGGFLAITNSSRHYSHGTFLADVSAACASAGCSATLCAEGGEGFDFPVDVRLPRSPELQWAVLELSGR
ncbi:putative ribosomal RNA large subunit methyltransferase I [Toxoplasma gondii MAS]|uniref:Putative ribosomal RNA large subunit methyltransferase I n=1 Tax=Toxoplasma gondii MAS TaxID=943118 RepID=A0A086Q7A9_TOXGO|nr:putative ribosomal RNA large subunit methyltransferase I [Toxoplasma gondii MAS]